MYLQMEVRIKAAFLMSEFFFGKIIVLISTDKNDNGLLISSAIFLWKKLFWSVYWSKHPVKNWYPIHSTKQKSLTICFNLIHVIYQKLKLHSELSWKHIFVTKQNFKKYSLYWFNLNKILWGYTVLLYASAWGRHWVY